MDLKLIVQILKKKCIENIGYFFLSQPTVFVIQQYCTSATPAR
jgi:hypothetical protein